jgi:branched-chain amino acid transport system substrate-binding protein
MKKYRLAFVLAVCFVLVALVAAACGGGTTTTTAAGGTTTSAGSATTTTAASGGTTTSAAAGGSVIKVGSLHPLSGDVAKMGLGVAQGFKLGVDEINAAGGIKSMGGAKIQIVEGDTQGKPEPAMSETERLITNENVSVIVGTFQSSTVTPTSQIAERNKVPYLVDIAISDKITDRGFKYLFRICPKADFYAKDHINFLKDMKTLVGLDVKKVALLYEDSDYGQSTSTGWKKYAAEAGMQIVADVSYPAGAADLTTQVSKIKDANPDSVLIARAREKLGMKTVFVDAANGPTEPDYIARLGNTAELMCTELEFTAAAGGVAKEVNDRYKAAFGYDITGNAAYAYQAAYVLADALERAGSADREKIREALAATKMTKNIFFPTSEISFGPDGQAQNAPLYVCQIQGGKLVPIWPAAFAAAKMILPQ